jgi:hypothetical protein
MMNVYDIDDDGNDDVDDDWNDHDDYYGNNDDIALHASS